MLGTYHLTVLYDIMNDLHFLYQPEKIYAYLVENLMKVTNAEAASIFEVDGGKRQLVLRACMGPKREQLKMIAEELPFPLGKGVCGWVAENNQAVLLEDVKKDGRFNSQFDALTGYKTRSILAAPLANKDKVLGVIEIMNKTSAAFNKNDLDLVALIAKHPAIALENGRLYEDLD